MTFKNNFFLTACQQLRDTGREIEVFLDFLLTWQELSANQQQTYAVCVCVYV